jgi:hypothetical protein
VRCDGKGEPLGSGSYAKLPLTALVSSVAKNPIACAVTAKEHKRPSYSYTEA